MLDKNIKVNWIKTSKFNTVAILISFINERKEENICKYVMLSSILGSATENYKTKKILNEKLYELYNCNIYWTAINMYKNENLSLYIEFINPKVVSDDKLLDEIFKLIDEFLFRPLLNDKKDAFDLKNFNEKKRLILEHIESIYNDKSRYAKNKLLEKMRRNDEFPLSNLISKESIDNITPASLYSFYKDILDSSYIIINGMGDFDSDYIIEKMKTFNLKSNEISKEFYSKSIWEKEECKYFEEVQNLEQAKLNIGFRTKISENDALYPAYVVFSAMFGGIMNSTLCSVVREERSMAYSIYSSILADRKVFMVCAGIDCANIEEVVKIVLKELDNYTKGNIKDKDKLLKMAKECILNDMIQVYDTQGSLLIRKLKDSISDLCKYEELIDKIHKVSLKDVIESSKQLYLDAIFVLKGNDKHECN